MNHKIRIIPVENQMRNIYIDFAKGIAIFLVLWGHSIQYFSNGAINIFEDSVFKFIYSFHMPLFMLLSGYLFYFSNKKRNLREIVINRITNIAIPMFIWNTLYYLFVCIESYYKKNQMGISIRNLINIQSGGLWFLWSVLSCSLLISFLSRITNEKLQLCLIIGAAPFVIILPTHGMNLFMYPYFIAGYLFNKYSKTISHKLIKIVETTSVILFPILLMFYKNEYFIYTSGISPFSSQYGFIRQIYIDIFRWIIGFAGSITVLLIMRWIVKKSIESKITKMISNYGKSTLQIYVMQHILLEYLGVFIIKDITQKIGYNILTLNIGIFNIVYTPAIAFLYITLIYGLSLIVAKNKILTKALFGR